MPICMSIVSPVYKGEKMIKELCSRIISNVQALTNDFEIILVNDASPDESWSIIEAICKQNKQVKGINLSRNFGQHNAITAGLAYAKGDWVVVMDCDLQDRPEEIPNLYKKAKQGYDIVLAQRIERQDNFFKRLSSVCFYYIFSYLTETKMDKTVANFGIYSNNVIKAILAMNDSIRYFPAMVQWAGFEKTYLPVKHNYREEGTSGYNLKKLLRLALNNILAFSDKPLRITVKFGFYISVSSVLIACFYFVKYWLGSIEVSGFTTIVLSIWFLSGIIITILGILGLYIGKIFDKVKDRPLFIISKQINI